MKLTEISWPVYKLGERRPSKDGDVLFYARHYKDKVEVDIIDDVSIPGNTLGKRRLWLSNDNIQLFKIRTALFFLGDFLRVCKPGIWFIDSMGTIFTYTKTKTVPLITRKITKVIRSTGSTLLEVEGLEHRMRCLFPPLDTQKYASVLKLSAHSYILYGFSDKNNGPTTRKV